jgi:prevent-host-death family protein
MARTTISSRKLNQDISGAKKAARSGPVVITDRGRPAFVLTTFADDQRLRTRKRLSVLDALAMPEDDYELNLPIGSFYQQYAEFD